MSNLRELLQETHTILDYNPKLETFKANVSRVLNAKYLEVSGQHPFNPFLIKRVDIKLYAPVKGSAGVTVGVAAGTRLVTGVGTTFASHMEGHVITIGGLPYTIVSVASGTQLYIDETVSGGHPATSDWGISFNKYALPGDCVEPLGITDREGERGRFVYIDGRTEEELLLLEKEEGDALVWLDADAENDRPPDDPLSAAAVAGGALPANTEFEYCYTIVAEGRESPPSLVSSAKTTATNFTIQLGGFEDLRVGGVVTGRTKRLYRRKKTDGGRWLLLATVAEAVTAYVDNGSVTPLKDEKYVLDEAGPRQYIRAWYTPSEDVAVSLRYHFLPRRLQNDADVPVWPKQYHRLLVYLTVEDIADANGASGLAQTNRIKAREMLDRMMRKYLTRKDGQLIRKGFGASNTPREPWGTPVKV